MLLFFFLINKETVNFPSLNIFFLWFLSIFYKMGQLVDALDHHPDSQKMAASHTDASIVSKFLI